MYPTSYLRLLVGGDVVNAYELVESNMLALGYFAQLIPDLRFDNVPAAPDRGR